MKPDTYTLLMQLDSIRSSLLFYGNEDISDDEKHRLSKKLAELSEMTRLKYELTSQYYFYAECKARQKYFELYGVDLK